EGREERPLDGAGDERVAQRDAVEREGEVGPRVVRRERRGLGERVSGPAGPWEGERRGLARRERERARGAAAAARRAGADDVEEQVAVLRPDDGVVRERDADLVRA